jgi:hydroxyquinol 1,2-dioxygenase
MVKTTLAGAPPMIDLDENTVTDATLAQMSTTPDPRLKEIMDAAVRHLHAFARDVNLTPAEWLTGIAVLTEVGKACTDIRQEFILLSDVLGLSAMVNALHDKKAKELGTQSSLLGPFFREGAAELPLGACIVANHTAPEIVLYGKVTDNDGNPLPNALVQVWQTDEHGLYDVQAHGDAHMDMRGNFRTVRPLGYSIPMDGPVGRLVQMQGRHGMRPSHVHMLITAPGHRELVSALYFGDDPNIGSDTVFGVSASLVIEARDNADCPIPGLKSVRYDFRMPVAGANDTGRVGADPASFKSAAE